MYSSNLDEISINIWTDVLSCNSSTCQNIDHVNQICYLYNYIIESISEASYHLKTVGNTRQNNNRVVGWNKYCRNLYKDAGAKFLAWYDGGKVR